MNHMSETDQGLLWEVFIQEHSGSPHVHAGSLRAPDSEMAVQNARDVYARRGTIHSIWVVKSVDIAATTSDDKASFFDSAVTKVYRHPHFYKLPKGMSDH
jgi:ring-1,2-phenylacetyl-CoA epoxidase subunit PaaB